MRAAPFTHIYWIGGSPCAGKSSVAEAIAAAAGWHYYKCDDHLPAQLQRAGGGAPTVHLLHQLSGDELWLRPVAEQLRTEIQYCVELFSLIVEDLRALPTERPLLAEGVPLLPHLVAPLLPAPRRGIWLVPDEPFQRHHYSRRPWVRDVLAGCRDPQMAFDRWMERDARFARWVTAQADAQQLNWLLVDGRQDLAQLTTVVRDWFFGG